MTIVSISLAAQILLLNFVIQAGYFPMVGGTSDKMVGLRCESLSIYKEFYFKYKI